MVLPIDGSSTCREFWIREIERTHSADYDRRQDRSLWTLRSSDLLAPPRDVLGGVTCIQHALRVLNDEVVIVGRMVGRDEHAVLRTQVRRCQVLTRHDGQRGIVPHPGKREDMRIVVRQYGPTLEQQP